MNRHEHISDADLARLGEDDLSPRQKQDLRRHLKGCPDCQARWEKVSAGARYLEALFCGPRELTEGVFTNEVVGQEADYWWSQYAGSQMMNLLVLAPEEIDRVQKMVGTDTRLAPGRGRIIRLPVLEPAQSETISLAAATGYGFAEQTLTQDDPPFEFHLVQFGKQLSIDVRAIGADPASTNCLARLEIIEGDACRYSQVLRVEKGKARLVLKPEEAAALRPREKPPQLRLEPLLTLEQLACLGVEAYLPILTGLLNHPDPKIRKGTVEVIARLRGPQAPPHVRHLADDPDESVRLAVRMALTQFPLSPEAQE